MSKHLCHAESCEIAVPPAMFMCRKHWLMLPTSMRHDVLEEYVPGQERDWGKVTQEYREVTRIAIDWLAEKEGVS